MGHVEADNVDLSRERFDTKFDTKAAIYFDDKSGKVHEHAMALIDYEMKRKDTEIQRKDIEIKNLSHNLQEINDKIRGTESITSIISLFINIKSISINEYIARSIAFIQQRGLIEDFRDFYTNTPRDEGNR